MKTIKFIKGNLFLLLILISTSIFAQTHDPDNSPYIGTWQYQNGNAIFKLTIWEDNTPNPVDHSYLLFGNYEMVQIVGSLRPVIYTSNPYKSPDYKSTLPVLSGAIFTQNDGTKAYGGSFKESHKGGTGLYGDFTIIKLPPCSGCPEKISWKVTKSKGMQIYKGKTPPSDFAIPNNIELTKVP